MKSIRTNPTVHAAEGDERIRTAVCVVATDPQYEQPFACPVCLGRCWMDTSFYTRLPVTTTEPCRSCGGTGIVWRAVAAASRWETPFGPSLRVLRWLLPTDRDTA